MLYLANPCTNEAVLAAMQRGELGFLDSPLQANKRPAGVTWAMDNGCFSDRWDQQTWWSYLTKKAGDSLCLFATAPDVVSDHLGTLERSMPWLGPMKELGYRTAFVLQDGCSTEHVPWESISAVFVGGSTDWKLGAEARALVHEARGQGKWVHMGRVNSLKRYRYAEGIGCQSVDGTFLTFGPDRRLPELLSWQHPSLFRFGV